MHEILYHCDFIPPSGQLDIGDKDQLQDHIEAVRKMLDEHSLFISHEYVDILPRFLELQGSYNPRVKELVRFDSVTFGDASLHRNLLFIIHRLRWEQVKFLTIRKSFWFEVIPWSQLTSLFNLRISLNEASMVSDKFLEDLPAIVSLEVEKPYYGASDSLVFGMDIVERACHSGVVSLVLGVPDSYKSSSAAKACAQNPSLEKLSINHHLLSEFLCEYLLFGAEKKLVVLQVLLDDYDVSVDFGASHIQSLEYLQSFIFRGESTHGQPGVTNFRDVSLQILEHAPNLQEFEYFSSAIGPRMGLILSRLVELRELVLESLSVHVLQTLKEYLENINVSSLLTRLELTSYEYFPDNGNIDPRDLIPAFSLRKLSNLKILQASMFVNASIVLEWLPYLPRLVELKFQISTGNDAKLVLSRIYLIESSQLQRLSFGSNPLFDNEPEISPVHECIADFAAILQRLNRLLLKSLVFYLKPSLSDIFEPLINSELSMFACSACIGCAFSCNRRII
jgi:hypothetical protein